jgi:hypothetical protein
MLACLVNIAAFVLMVWLDVRDHFALFVIGMIAALGPVYLGRPLLLQYSQVLGGTQAAPQAI